MDATSILIEKQDIEEISAKKPKPLKQGVVDERMINKIMRGNFKG